MAAVKSAVDQLYAEYKRTAPRLDLEFMIQHVTIPMPLAMLQACAAEHAACVRDEPKGRNHGKHRSTVEALTLAYRAFVCQRLTPAVYHAPTFTADEYAAIACTDDPDRAYDEACILDADFAAGYVERQAIADAGFAYETDCRRGRYTYNEGKAA